MEYLALSSSTWITGTFYLAGLHASIIWPLPANAVHRATAKVVCSFPPCRYANPVLICLHWLLVWACIWFRSPVLAYHCFHPHNLHMPPDLHNALLHSPWYTLPNFTVPLSMMINHPPKLLSASLIHLLHKDFL
ncbi:hypothetical protein AAFF_G00273890 [Aldrovandia affinis]|uniref:Uncharacterized protein n=1 Tax=Aldrovandia affinis TaxID=143900 RepID=A0AAD7WSE7_9TELE|nr:hypothetical protein AAFF_G00273890 [Aldrovandia affinis]